MKTIITKRFVARAFGTLSCIGVLSLTASAGASVVWQLNPNNQNGNVGSSTQTFTSGGYSITARGFDNVPGTDPTHELYYKSQGPIGGAGEHGLGLTGTANNELQVNRDGTPAQYIQLDLTSILSQGFKNGQIEVTSVQSGEQFSLFGSSSQGTLGILLGTFNSSFDDHFVAVPNFGQFTFVSVTAAIGDVLPVAFRADITPVPEMSALFPLVGLFAAVASTHVLRRRRMIQMQDVRL